MTEPTKLVFQVEEFDGYICVIITEQKHWLSEGVVQDYYSNEEVDKIMESLNFGQDSESTYSSLKPRTVEGLHEELLKHPNFIYDENFSKYVKTGYET